MTARHYVSPEGYLGKFGSPKFTVWIVINFTNRLMFSLAKQFPCQFRFQVCFLSNSHANSSTYMSFSGYNTQVYVSLLPCSHASAFTLIASTEVIWIQEAWLRSPYLNLLFEAGLGPLLENSSWDIWTIRVLFLLSDMQRLF